MNRLPTLFISHGAPTFALAPGGAGEQLGRLGRQLPEPRAVLVVSPHWTTQGIEVMTGLRPPTVHDFGGFPQALYQLRYPVDGHPQLAGIAAQLLAAAGYKVILNEQQGLDHGAWVPLLHLFPKGQIPVFQVSMPADLTVQGALDLGAALAPLREQGVLIIGSGSMTHNLAEFSTDAGEDAAYVQEFTLWIRAALLAGDLPRLIDYRTLAPHAQRAHPSEEHLLPLMVALGAAATPTAVQVLDGGITHGMLAMESYVFGDLPTGTI
ncbi:MAG: dioxygenase [Betaproteobacteria bacterium]|nr:dioxygenase [Betaproteobacteria bacterium]